MTDKPEYGKQYRLTGAGASIANGNTWAESEVPEEDDPAFAELMRHIDPPSSEELSGMQLEASAEERYALTHCAHTIPGTCDFCPDEAREFFDDHIKVITVPIPKPKEA